MMIVVGFIFGVAATLIFLASQPTRKPTRRQKEIVVAIRAELDAAKKISDEAGLKEVVWRLATLRTASSERVAAAFNSAHFYATEIERLRFLRLSGDEEVIARLRTHIERAIFTSQTLVLTFIYADKDIDAMDRGQR